MGGEWKGWSNIQSIFVDIPQPIETFYAFQIDSGTVELMIEMPSSDEYYSNKQGDGGSPITDLDIKYIPLDVEGATETWTENYWVKVWLGTPHDDTMESVISGLTHETKYRISVRAKNKNSQSTDKTWVSRDVTINNTGYRIPNLNAWQLIDGQTELAKNTTLSWEHGVDEDGYVADEYWQIERLRYDHATEAWVNPSRDTRYKEISGRSGERLYEWVYTCPLFLAGAEQTWWSNNCKDEFDQLSFNPNTDKARTWYYELKPDKVTTGLHADSGRLDTGYYIDIDSGATHACGIRVADPGDPAARPNPLPTAGKAICWGSDDNGQVSGAPDYDITAIEVGDGFSCAIKDSDRKPTCWGATTKNTEVREDVPDKPAKEISAGDSVVCIIIHHDDSTNPNDLKPDCWGNTSGAAAKVVELPGPPDVTMRKIAVGSHYACGIPASGAKKDVISCWGR